MANKLMSLTLGYNEYALSLPDAIALIDIATRMRQIKQDKYNSPYYFVADADPLVTMAHIVDVEESSEPLPDEPIVAAPGHTDDEVVF